mmetsp:Transcript_1681/g.4354  ORF Transcript_1681/g.4354 Transcript_1681/m.4354 type:complete len:163 (+) Transcript_1681:72-560(+)|eukprot:CAMPEP_0197182746 /NCGR_PEP_ID=MMETSP1423-20130617/6634_1 /TAXON_ID=476441 /ORGANISM="Pseudo-nitzschia heimii, Strain UNC1101" /LENGTH=162 /DNA_ID=CAMNT_0042633211 /DNA_START=57 /DNA_END=545 /DNA_ORIENTATION=-
MTASFALCGSRAAHRSNDMCLFELFLGSQLAGVPALFLAAVDGLRGKTSVALSADVLLAVELAGEHRQGRIVHPSPQSQDEMQGGFLLDVVIAEGAAVLQLLSGEDESLLIRRDSLLVLDLGLDVVDGVRRFHVEGDGLSRQGFHENLHGFGDLLFQTVKIK